MTQIKLSINFTDDAAVSQLLNKLDQCSDADKYSRVMRQLQDLFENGDQRVRTEVLYTKERERGGREYV